MIANKEHEDDFFNDDAWSLLVYVQFFLKVAQIYITELPKQ